MERKRRVPPGLLSSIGTIPLFTTAYPFLTASCSGSQCRSPNLTPLFGIFLALEAVVFLAFSVALFIDYNHRRVWGAIVALIYASPAILGISDILNAVVVSSSIPGWLDPLSLANELCVLLGLIGGVWGFFWKTGPTPPNATTGLAGQAERVVVED